VKTIDELCVNTIRFLAVDSVEKAQSGHPGLPLGAAPMAYVLWDRVMRHNPDNPGWFNRDRFILSAGHGSALLYALLHVYGYGLGVDELKQFRQWGSKTPGHPEYGLTTGVEATTGPLGQGFGMGVGMAIAERFIGECFNINNYNLMDHFTYAIVSDGDLMEGVSSEAASLAGTLKLGKLIYLYDDNHISIEGGTDIAFTENVKERFVAYGWHVQKVSDGNDLDSIESAVREAQKVKDQPSLIIVRTHIGYASPKQDDASAHGEPLGEDALKATKKRLRWPADKSFYVPGEAAVHFKKSATIGAKTEEGWNKLLKAYKKEYSDLAQNFERIVNGELPRDWDNDLPIFAPDGKPIATRAASGKVMNTLSKRLPHYLVGGSADLAPSTKTILMGYGDFGFGAYCSHNLHFGVREHGMGTIVNGMALHGGTLPYGATFLVFSDYMRPSIRIAALMSVHVIFIFTHDSIGLGEDGPTHQPVEHLMSLRAIPNLTVMRPADANETAYAWVEAIKIKGPVALVLSRQKLPILDTKRYPVLDGVSKGAYVLSDSKSEDPDLILIATGAEIHLALKSQAVLNSKGISTRVVSMPSWELFENQSSSYRTKVLPRDVPKLAIEAGVTLGWGKYIGEKGKVIGLDRFGASAPGKVALEKLGFNVENVVKRALGLVRGEE
jgi:transketolase